MLLRCSLFFFFFLWSFRDFVEPVFAIPLRMRGSVCLDALRDLLALDALCDLLPPPSGASLPCGEVLYALCVLGALSSLSPLPFGEGSVCLDALCDLLCLDALCDLLPVDALCDLLPPPSGASLPSGEVFLAVSVSALCDFGFGVLGDPRLLCLEDPVELVLRARFIVVVCVVCVVCGVVGKASAVRKQKMACQT
jgi:hypothetical protein